MKLYVNDAFQWDTRAHEGIDLYIVIYIEIPSDRPDKEKDRRWNHR